PPYNANQANENDNNKNREYPDIDKRIKHTYIAASTAQKTKRYDMYSRFFRWASDRLNENGVLAFITNRNFIDSREADGFRKTVAQEFADIYVVDLGGDVRANPKLSGTKHNVFGIQTGVAISFMVKRVSGTKEKRLARVYYLRRPEMETADEKLGFLNGSMASALDFEELTPNANGNWLNPGSGEFEQLLPLAPRQGAKCIFSFGANAIKTNRDDWVFDFSLEQLKKKAAFQVERFNAQLKKGTADADSLDYSIKWSSGLKAVSSAVVTNDADFVEATWRPFVRKRYFSHKAFSDRLTAHHYAAFGRDLSRRNPSICFVFGSRLEFCAFAVDVPVSYSLLVLDPVYCLSERRYVDNEQSVDNITDWALKQFTTHYKPETGSGKGAKKITKEAIFHYCYAVLHDPLYREKYAQNLKREFPRIPFYADFWQWAAWGEALMALHIGYEQVAPFALTRTDTPDDKARAAGLPPKALLRADPEAGSIALDSETTLRGIPADAWLYKLGNRSALDWVLDQYKEKKPKDPTIREQFDTYRFADYKEKVIDLLMRVTTVSVETVRTTQAMRTMAR
ncbi:MAG: type ISP restriction/modification enzyme, partial [Thiobacillus sp.]